MTDVANEPGELGDLAAGAADSRSSRREGSQRYSASEPDASDVSESPVGKTSSVADRHRDADRAERVVDQHRAAVAHPVDPSRGCRREPARSGARRRCRAGRSGLRPRSPDSCEARRTWRTGPSPRRARGWRRTPRGRGRPERDEPWIFAGPRSLPAWGSMATTSTPGRRGRGPARSPTDRGSSRSRRSARLRGLRTRSPRVGAAARRSSTHRHPRRRRVCRRIPAVRVRSSPVSPQHAVIVEASRRAIKPAPTRQVASIATRRVEWRRRERGVPAHDRVCLVPPHP